MGANERALFEAIVLAWSENTPLTVRKAIGLEPLGSPATLHKRVTRLRQEGLIDALTREDDRRTKYLVPTSKGLDYSRKLGEALVLCATS